MARIRTIKPEFFTSEDIVCMTPLARLFYVSLWCEADREGLLEWKPITFKMRYLPGDDCNVNELAQELIGRGLIVLYTVDGKQYAEIPTFTEHQVINNREQDSSLPSRSDVQKAAVPILTPEMRTAIILRDGSKCLRCGAVDDLTVDHIFPQSMGGTHKDTNLRCLCRSCNSARPVAGEAFIADLKRDGFTLNHMSRLCFDASSRVKGSSSRVKAEGKEGKEGNGKEHAAFSAGFLRFWKTWPPGDRKQDKSACMAKWLIHELEPLTDRICADVEAKKAGGKWLAGFVEMPMTYLNNRRWEDADEDSSEWSDTRKGIERRAVELGIGAWNETEQFPVYKARVIAAHTGAAA